MRIGPLFALLIAATALSACQERAVHVDLPQTVWPQADKLFVLATQAHDEFQAAFRAAAFTVDAKREGAQSWMRDQDFAFEYVRILHVKAQREQTLSALLELVAGIRSFVSVPSYTFNEYKDGNEREVVSLAKLRELENEVNVATTALLRDVK